MNRHRKAIYTMRREILNQPDISKRIKLIIEQEAGALAGSELIQSTEYEAMLQEIFPFDEKTLDKLFDADVNTFGKQLKVEALKFYETRQKTFSAEIMRKIERDIYLQTLDNLWMQHLENMDHLREGIHWISVGQRDPLVEYRRQGQHLFEEMQAVLRHDVVRMLFHAEPVPEEELDEPIETELTKAARQSVDNADRIIEAEDFHETDFNDQPDANPTKKTITAKSRKKARKAERQRRHKKRNKR